MTQIKVWFLAAFVFFLLACSGKKAVVKKETPAVEQVPAAQGKANNDQSLEEFLKKFEDAVISHDNVGMLALMDKEYKAEQHDKMLKGNTEKFLDEFFCNYQTNGQGFKCIKFDDITAVKRIETMPNDGNFTVVYHVTGKGITIKTDYLVVVKKEAGKTVYGFYGAVG